MSTDGLGASEADGSVPPGDSSPTTDEADTGSDSSGAAPDPSPPACGDGIVDADERCDDGNNLDGDDCSADCRHPVRPCTYWGTLVMECGNQIDEDGDGLIDLDDPDCLSACDDSEALFSMQLPTDNNDQNGVDCYWDTNAGQGDDGCWHDLRCDPLSPGAPDYPYVPGNPSCELRPPPTPECLAKCGPMTPNGCDCFGCCILDGTPRFLGIFSQGADEPPCAHDQIELCNPCTIEQSCFDPCEPDACELCAFRDPAELPPSCRTPSCAPGVPPCTDPYACGVGFKCAGGCCLPEGLG